MKLYLQYINIKEQDEVYEVWDKGWTCLIIRKSDEFSICVRYKTMREYWKSMTSKHGNIVPSKFPGKKCFGNMKPEL